LAVFALEHPNRRSYRTEQEWWSIEVLNGPSSAARWKDAHGAALVEAALTNGAVDWAWQEHPWGVILEVAFLDEWHWDFFYALPAVQAALDAVPDPLSGLAVYRAGVAARAPVCRVGPARWPVPARSSCPSPTRTRPGRSPSGRPGSSRGSMTTTPRPCPTRCRWTNLPPARDRSHRAPDVAAKIEARPRLGVDR